MKKRRLRKWVKVLLGLIFLVVLTILFVKSIDNYNNDLVKCDSQKGYTCNIFEK